MIALLTVGLIAFFLTALVAGPVSLGLGGRAARELARQAVGLPPDRAEIDADWKRKRRL